MTLEPTYRTSFLFTGLSRLILACAISLLTPLVSSAALITVPTDLNVGDKYRLAFVTSTGRNATSSNIAVYNSFVSSVAAAAPELAALGTTWTAIGSTASVAARDNTSTNPSTATGVPIYRLDDVRIASNNSDLWDGTILASLSITDLGASVGTQVWTGTVFDGTPAPFGPLGNPFPPQANSGHSAATTSAWIAQTGGFSTGTSFRLYAISGELTVVPEPGTAVLGIVGCVLILWWSKRRK